MEFYHTGHILKLKFYFILFFKYMKKNWRNCLLINKNYQFLYQSWLSRETEPMGRQIGQTERRREEGREREREKVRERENKQC